MPKAIIFGVHGQDGFYLNKLLVEKKIETIGVSRSDGNWIKGDVSDKAFVEALIKKEKPELVFHLAANSALQHELLFEHQQTIANGSLYILESVLTFSPGSKIFISGSGLQFKNYGQAIKETNVFDANSAYTLSRIQAVFAARYYRSKGLKAYVGYLFHHDSPLRTAQHLNRKIVDFVKSISSDSKLLIGDITIEKEYGFANDIVNGIYHLINQENVFEACIGTGKCYTIKKWLELCFAAVGKNWVDYVELKDNFVPDFRRLVSDPSTMQSIGWQATTSIEQLAEIMFNN
jgi:GDPmannose 4,6-dehydratase